jgi:hypothetical protein
VDARITLMDGEIKTLTKTVVRLEKELAELKSMLAQPSPKRLAPLLPTKPLPPPVVPSKPTPAKLEAHAEQRVAKRESIQVNRQRAKLDRVAENIAIQPLQHRLLLHMLLGEPSQWFAAHYIASKNGYSDDRFIRNPPKNFTNYGLVERDGSCYRINPKLYNNYPDLREEEIRSKLRGACAVVAFGE